jgi:hypothetical protein
MSQFTSLISGKKKDKQPGEKKDEKKTKKRVNNFLNEKNLQKKWKILTKIVEKESEEDLHKFLTENADNVFLTIMTVHNQLETSKDKTKKSHEADALQVLEVLKNVLPHWSSQLKTRWRFDDILTLLQKLLARQNKHCVRVYGFEILLIFIDTIFQSDVAKESLNSVLDLFARAINLQIFDPKQEVIVKYTPPNVDPNVLLIPAQTPETEEEAIELLNVFCDFLNSRVGKSVDFWFDQFRRVYLAVFYPRVFKEIGLLPHDNKFGFVHHCPYPVQRLFVEHFDKWKTNSTLCAKLWEDKNANFMLEVSRQCCQLPITYAGTIRKLIQLYRHWFVTKRGNTMKDEVVQECWRALLDNITAIFTIEPQDKHEDYSNLFQEVFGLYNSLSVNMSTTLEPQTWHTLQYSVLNTTVKFFETYKSLRNPPQCVETVADELISYLFLIWFRSPIANEKMWHDFHVKFVILLDFPHAIRGWKDKLLKLTMILGDFYYKSLTKEEGTDEDPTHGAQQQSTVDSSPATPPSTTSSSAGPTSPLHSSQYVASVSKETKEPRFAVPKEMITNYLGVTCNEVKAKELWFTILNICGNINAIKNPLIYEVAMSCIAEVVDLFLAFEKRIPLKDDPRKMPLMETFLPWLFQACYSPPDKIQGIVIAYRVLCRLFCCQHKKPPPLELLTHFYRVLQNGLRYEREQVRDAVIASAKNIFCFDLPGVAVLIPDFFREITNIFGARAGVSSDMQRNAITLLNSLICLPKHYEGINFCDIVSRRDISSAELREYVSNLIISLLNNPNLDSTAKAMALWGSCVLIFDEVKSGAQVRMNVITNALQALLEHIKHREESVALTAIDVLTAFTVLIDAFNDINPNLTFSVISILCDNVTFLIREPGSIPAKEKVISECFQCLASWLVARPNVFLTDPELSAKIFQVVELGLFGTLGSDLSQPVSENIIHPNIENIIEKDDKKKKKEDKDKKNIKDTKKRGTNEVSEPLLQTRRIVVETLLEKLARQPIHGSTPVQQSAEMFLFTLSNFYNNYPSPAGAAQNDCVVPEEAEENSLFFMNFERQIFSVSQATNAAGEKIARVILRDPLGKFCWECQIEYGDEFAVSPSQHSKLPTQNPTVVMQQARDRAAEGAKPPNILAEMLTSLYTKYPECSDEKITSLYYPHKFRDSYAGEIQMGRSLVDGIIQLDNQTFRTYVETRLRCDKDMQKPEEPLSSFQLGRLLLSHFGFISPRNRRNLHLIEDSTRWRRALADLDKVKGREVFKVGVIYVAEGQETQNEILMNEAGSALYHTFLNGLGWLVDLKEHQGFRGGLTTDGTVGVVAPYWANERCELIYHVVTFMPTKESDPVQITKKRHVGNDFVHIIWSEHKRDYNPETIVSQFNDAHIVVYPLSSGLFRIQIFKKDKLKLFGPLLDGMVVNQQILSELVRITALNASRSVRSTQKGYENPYITRLNYIKEACQRYRIPKPAEDFIAALFPPRHEPQSANAAFGTVKEPRVPAEASNTGSREAAATVIMDTPFRPYPVLPTGVKMSAGVLPPLNLPTGSQQPSGPVQGAMPPSPSGVKPLPISSNAPNVGPKGGGLPSPKVSIVGFRPPPPNANPPPTLNSPPHSIPPVAVPTQDHSSPEEPPKSPANTNTSSLPRQQSSPALSSAIQHVGGNEKKLPSALKGVTPPSQGKLPKVPTTAPVKIASPTIANSPNSTPTPPTNRPPPPLKKASNFTLSRPKTNTEGAPQ